MNKIHPLSKITTLADFDIFTVPPTQLSIEKNLVSEYRPLTAITNNSSIIEFNIESGLDEYIQLREMQLYLRCKIDITKAAGNVGANDWKKIAGINNLLPSMFKAVDIEINGKSITLNPQTYHYKAYFETNFGYPFDCQSTYLTSQGYFTDDARKTEFSENQSKLITPDPITTDGKGKTLELKSRLYLDLCQQPKALLGGVKLKITLVPEDPKFYLWTKDDTITPKVTFEYVSLFVAKSKVTSAIVEGHNLALMRGNAKYPLSRGHVKAFTINQGLQDISLDNIISGQIPRRIFVTMVKNKAFLGDFKSNPYNFEHFNLNYITASIDGVQYPQIAFTPNFAKNLYLREYLNLFDVLNQYNTDSAIYLDRDDFKDGNAIFAFNFGADSVEDCYKSGYVNPTRSGSVGLQLKFSQALAEPISVVVYCEYDNILEIDINRDAIPDYI